MGYLANHRAIINESYALRSDTVLFYIPVDFNILASIVLYEIENRLITSFEDLGGVLCPEIICNIGPFANRKLLILHVLSTHGGVWFICGSCPRGFISEDLRFQHSKESHDVEILRDSLVKINIAKILTKEHTNFTTFSRPITCKYRLSESFFMGCHFLASLPVDGTLHNTKVILQSCLENPILRMPVNCPSTDANGHYCQLSFNSCRDLIFHLNTFHFGYKTFCIVCLDPFNSVADIIIHNQNIHAYCVDCHQQFDDILIFDSHINEIADSVTPYIDEYPEDIHCALFLPNLAFHFSNMMKASMAGVNMSHPCVDLDAKLYSLNLLMNNVVMTQSDISKIHQCLNSKIVEYSREITCSSHLCVGDAIFRYKNCRQMLVHMLLRHSMWINFRYICNLCLKAMRKDELPFHINQEHDRFVCIICLWSYKEELSLRLHQLTSGHIIE